MKLPILATSLTLILGLFGPAIAAPTMLQCEVKNGRTGTFIPPVFFVGVAGDNKVIVVDEVSFGATGAPMSAQVLANNDKRLTIKWRIDNVVNDRKQDAIFDYKISWLKYNGKFMVKAVPVGYSNTFSGQGICGPVKNKKLLRIMERAL